MSYVDVTWIGQMIQDGMKSPEVWGVIFLITIVVGFLAITLARKKEIIQNAHWV